MNINCVICSDLFGPSDSIFTTPCGHLFHHPCVAQWLERSKSCPQCRQKCDMKSIFRVYFNHSSNSQLDNTENTATLHDKIDTLALEMREKDTILKKNAEETAKYKENNKKCVQTIQRLELHVDQNKLVIRALKQENELLGATNKSYKDLENENNELKAKLNSMEVVQSVLVATQKDAEDIMRQNLDPKSLCVMVGALKRELCSNEIRKQEIKKQLLLVQKECRQATEKKKFLEERMNYFESENHRLVSTIKRARLEDHINGDADDRNRCEGLYAGSPKPKKLKLSLGLEGSQNTPSPMSASIFKDRVAKVKESDSPYFKIKSSSVGLAPLIRIKSTDALPPCGLSNFRPTNQHILDKFVPMSTQEKSLHKRGLRVPDQLSIFKNARMAPEQSSRPSNMIYNGMGGSERVLMSDLRKPTKDENPTPTRLFQKRQKHRVKNFVIEGKK